MVDGSVAATGYSKFMSSLERNRMTEGRTKKGRMDGGMDGVREGAREGRRKDGVIRRWSMVGFKEIDFSVG